MNTVKELFDWTMEFREKHFEAPKTIPLTKDEIKVAVEECGCIYLNTLCAKNKLFNIDIEPSEFASSLRERRLDIGVSQYMIEFGIYDSIIQNADYLQSVKQGIDQIKVYVLSDSTRLKVTLDWDPWAWFKKLLHITKFFPIKKQEVTFDCKVLYPYCKVQFPHNKHTFKVQQSPK